MIFLTAYGLVELNCRIVAVAQHLYGNQKFFILSNVSEAYKSAIERAEVASGVLVLYYTIETNHVHYLIAFDRIEQLYDFFRRLNIGFGAVVRNLTNKEKEPVIMEGKRVFQSSPRVTPQYGYVQFLEAA